MDYRRRRTCRQSWQAHRSIPAIPSLTSLESHPTHISVYGDGTNVWDWLYSQRSLQHCRDIRALLDGGQIGETYNIGAERAQDHKGQRYTADAEAGRRKSVDRSSAFAPAAADGYGHGPRASPTVARTTAKRTHNANRCMIDGVNSRGSSIGATFGHPCEHPSIHAGSPSVRKRKLSRHKAPDKYTAPF